MTLLKLILWLMLLVYDKEVFAASCRVAVCFSGHVRSFVYPVVFRSIRRNLIEAIEADGCQVDVFAYATLQDSVGRSKQALNSEHTPDMTDVETSMDALAPTRLVWHHEQAGLIPKSCIGEKKGNATAKPASADEDRDGFQRHWEMFEEEYSERLYWQLYKSKAAYRMALREESRGGFVYDWVVRARFDLAWLRPLPPLSAFSAEVVWFADNVWPMSDDFALVPRSFSESFFSAISTFYACDGSSWPPPTSWWQPNCYGREFEACTLFRHLHASDIPYRTYPMFNYVLARSGRGTRCDFTENSYSSACSLLGLGALLPSTFHIDDCATALGQWAGRRCKILTSSGSMTDLRRCEVIVDPEPRAWEILTSTLALEAEERTLSGDGLERLRSNLASLRDAVIIPPRMSAGKARENPEFTSRLNIRHDTRWDRGRNTPKVWRVDSPFNCDMDKYPGRAPQLIKYYTGGPSLTREVALATKCRAHRLAGGLDIGGNFNSTLCAHVRPLELVMIDVSLHWKELGVCTSDGSLGMSGDEQINQFFGDPAAHCVGYGKLDNEYL